MSSSGSSLRAVLDALSPDRDGGWAVSPTDDWRQGRTLYGGLTTALCAESARRLDDSLPALRSAQIAFIGPASGRVRCAPALLRRGRSAAFVGIDAFGGDGLCARVTLTYGVARESAFDHLQATAPDVPAPTDCAPLVRAGAPTFLGHFDVRVAGGAVPFSGGSEPELVMWARHRDAEDGAVDPTVALLAIADVLPPAASPLFTEWHPISTMTWSLEILDTPATSDWYLLRSSGERTGDGYSVQTMGCWDADGRCLALSRQTVAVF